MLVPLHGFVLGDTLGLVVLVQDSSTVGELARVLGQAASVRVSPAASARVVAGGRELPLHETVESAGLRPLERVDLILDDRPSPPEEP